MGRFHVVVFAAAGGRDVNNPKRFRLDFVVACCVRISAGEGSDAGLNELCGSDEIRSFAASLRTVMRIFCCCCAAVASR